MVKNHKVSAFDLTVGADRGDYEDMMAEGDRVIGMVDHPIPSTGAIIRIVDHEHDDDPPPAPLPYKKPVC